jgi:hypothetical protein
MLVPDSAGITSPLEWWRSGHEVEADAESRAKVIERSPGRPLRLAGLLTVDALLVGLAWYRVESRRPG